MLMMSPVDAYLIYSCNFDGIQFHTGPGTLFTSDIIYYPSSVHGAYADLFIHGL